MKTLKIHTLIGTIALALIFISCSKSESIAPTQSPPVNDSKDLSGAEAAFLLSTVEKQKMHSDVYNEMDLKAKDQIFTIMSEDDVQYKEMLSAIVDKYGLDNPISDKISGEYEDHKIQATYDDFINNNNYNWEEMLLYAQKMEEMLITDLQFHLANVSGHADVSEIYNDLIKESKGQLEALNKELRSIGDSNI